MSLPLRLAAVEKRLNAIWAKLSRLTEEVRAVQNRQWQGEGGIGGGSGGGFRGLQVGVVITPGITARTTITPGTGTIRILDSSGSTLVEVTNEEPEIVAVKNLTDNAIATSAYVAIVDDKNGDWWVLIPGSCSNLS